ncbi:MAG: prephenate dehydratase [Bacteroidota bacterium]
MNTESTSRGSNTVIATTITTPKKVVIQGYAGAFHQIAAELYFKDQAIDIVPANSFDELVALAERPERADTALMAIENSVAGSLMYNYDLLRQSKLKIVGEIYLRIKQNLMTLPGVRLEDLQEVHSHYMAIAQCRDFFRAYPHIKLIETADTALSAKDIRDNNWQQVGAIASTLAAELYDLEIIGSSIETNKQNYTRFWVLARENESLDSSKVEKVSICFATDHEVGSLYRVLSVLSAYGINLTSIQSTPIIGKPWEYRIFVDFITDGKVSLKQAIDGIRPLTYDLEVMGMYGLGEQYEY